MELLFTTYVACEKVYRWGFTDRFTVCGYYVRGTRRRARSQLDKLLQLDHHRRDHRLPDGVHDNVVACAADSSTQLLGLVIGTHHTRCGELDGVAVDYAFKRLSGQSAKLMGA
jgi:hypothetical protein